MSEKYDLKSRRAVFLHCATRRLDCALSVQLLEMTFCKYTCLLYTSDAADE